MGDEVFMFVEQLEQLSSEAAVIAALERILATLDIRYFMFLQDWPSAREFEQLVFCRRVPERWFRLYIREHYSGIDPAFSPGRRSNRPYVWLETAVDANENPRTAAFVRRAAGFGLVQGLIVPIPRPRGRQGVVWFGGANAGFTAGTASALHLVALYAFERLRRFHAPFPQKTPLITQREREVLEWAAKGKTAQEIGELLGIRKRTVEEHLQSAQRKLGAVNRTQTVVIALRDGAIDL